MSLALQLEVELRQQTLYKYHLVLNSEARLSIDTIRIYKIVTLEYHCFITVISLPYFGWFSLSGECSNARGRGRGRGRGRVQQRRRGLTTALPGRQSTCESTSYKSTKGDVVWQKKSTGARKYAPQNVMRQQPGPTAYAVRRSNNLVETFQLFVTPRMMDIIIQMSNKEGRRVYGDEWKDLSLVELNAYFGILILAGVYRSGGEATQELWDSSTGRQIFRAVMSRQRFHDITRILRFDDKETRSARRNKDRLAPIRDIFDLWVETFSKCFIPYENLTVDEQLVAFRGRCSFRQYMKSKPAKYGLKLWVLCDSTTSYVMNIQAYTGRQKGQPPEKNQGERVVHDLVEVVKGTGRNITTDNFFTSVPLARQLITKKLSLVGTLRKNKPEIPPEFLPARNREVNSSLFGHQDNMTLVSYVPKKGKAVILLSSMHLDAEVSNRDDKKPQVIIDYNSTKGGVDTVDQMASIYSTKRKTNRYYHYVILNNLLFEYVFHESCQNKFICCVSIAF